MLISLVASAFAGIPNDALIGRPTVTIDPTSCRATVSGENIAVHDLKGPRGLLMTEAEARTLCFRAETDSIRANRELEERIGQIRISEIVALSRAQVDEKDAETRAASQTTLYGAVAKPLGKGDEAYVDMERGIVATGKVAAGTAALAPVIEADAKRQVGFGGYGYGGYETGVMRQLAAREDLAVQASSPVDWQSRYSTALNDRDAEHARADAEVAKTKAADARAAALATTAADADTSE